MTKKDYELIASAVRQMFSLKDDHLYVADMLAAVLGADNPKFDRSKFLEACGVTTMITGHVPATYDGGKTYN